MNIRYSDKKISPNNPQADFGDIGEMEDFENYQSI